MLDDERGTEDDETAELLRALLQRADDDAALELERDEADVEVTREDEGRNRDRCHCALYNGRSVEIPAAVHGLAVGTSVGGATSANLVAAADTVGDPGYRGCLRRPRCSRRRRRRNIRSSGSRIGRVWWKALSG